MHECVCVCVWWCGLWCVVRNDRVTCCSVWCGVRGVVGVCVCVACWRVVRYVLRGVWRVVLREWCVVWCVVCNDRVTCCSVWCGMRGVVCVCVCVCGGGVWCVLRCGVWRVGVLCGMCCVACGV